MVQAVFSGDSYQDPYQTVVPVDVYQDLVTELKETQALARNLEIQNRELWQQNQQLQQEMTKVAGAVQTFQQRVPTVAKAETSEALAVQTSTQKTSMVAISAFGTSLLRSFVLSPSGSAWAILLFVPLNSTFRRCLKPKIP
jgi:hypothetical protein